MGFLEMQDVLQSGAKILARDFENNFIGLLRSNSLQITFFAIPFANERMLPLLSHTDTYAVFTVPKPSPHSKPLYTPRIPSFLIIR